MRFKAVLTFAIAVGMLAGIPHRAVAQQTSMIDARMSGKAGNNGKCTFEVVVQGTADVQIRGSQGRLVRQSGNPAQWRRLDCNQPLPANPTNFKFTGVDGHGRQSLAADPNSNNGIAVVHIVNNSNNNEGYTGDITWSGGSSTAWSNPQNSGSWGNWNDNSGWSSANSNWGGQNSGGPMQNIRARVSGGGGNGKCTFEVAANGVAEVEIRGEEGRLRTISGNPAQWRRLDCNQAMPINPVDFKFSGVDGHGQQTLVQSPGSNNGVAVIRIDNGNRGNNEGYTGDLTWHGGNSNSSASSGWGNGPQYQWSDSGSNWNGNGSSSAAAQACQDYIGRRVSREHSEVVGVQMLPDSVAVMQGGGNIVRVKGQGQYQSSGGGSGGFQYRCEYNAQTGQIVDSAYRQ